MANIGLQYLVDLKVSYDDQGNLRPYVLEFQPDGCFSGFIEATGRSLKENVDRVIRDLKLADAPSSINGYLKPIFIVGEDKAAHIRALGDDNYGILPKEYFCESWDVDVNKILSHFAESRDLVLKHRNMARGEGVYYVQNAHKNLADILNASSSSLKGKIKLLKSSETFIVQEGVTNIPVFQDGSTLEFGKELNADQIAFDATMRYVFVIEITEEKECIIHPVNAYWKFPLMPIGSGAEINKMKLSDSVTQDREYPKSAVVENDFLQKLNESMNPNLQRLLTDILASKVLKIGPASSLSRW